MKDYYLTIDAGTTAIKVCAVDSGFRLAASVNMEYTLCTEGSLATLEPEIYWNYTKEGIRRIAARMEGGRLLGIAITTQGETMIPVDAEGQELYNAVVWLDGRAGEEAEEIKGLVNSGEFYRKTGIPECNEFCPVSKMLWFRRKRPKIYARTKYFFLLEDYLIFRLTGRAVTEKSLLSTTGYFDIEEDRIWDELLHKCGLAPDKIPQVLDCGEIAGELLAGTAEELGLPLHIPVVTGAMDQVCGAIGAGNFFPGLLTETTGTALCIGKTINKTAVCQQYRIPVYRHYRKELQLLLPVCMTAGMALKWFKDTFCEKEAEEAASSGREVYDLLNALAEESQPLAGGVIMLPYLSGSLQPCYAPGYRGGFLGVGLDSRKSDFVRALMEGVAYMLKENLRLLDSMGESGSSMVSMGGGAKSPVWCQIKADVTGMDIYTLRTNETASVGAAMLCRMGIAGQTRLEEGPQETAAVYHPRPALQESYEKGYENYLWFLQRTI